MKQEQLESNIRNDEMWRFMTEVRCNSILDEEEIEFSQDISDTIQ